MIVADPATARPVPGAVDVLHRLAHRFAEVAVISARPVSFLTECLDLVRPGSQLTAVGLSGLERTSGSGVTAAVDGLAAFIEPLRAARAELSVELGPALRVTGDDRHVAVSWRAAPSSAALAEHRLAEVAASHDLHVVPGLLSADLVPSLPIDKGTVITELGDGREALLFAGDSEGDLPAFDAIDALEARPGFDGEKVAVGTDELPAALMARADRVLPGPDALVELLVEIAERFDR